MTDRSASHFYNFAHFRLDAGDRLLLRGGEIVRLRPKVFEILLLLVQHSGHVLTKDELINAVWPDSFVEESNLARSISTLRQALGDGGYIETVPRRGYRFAAGVRESGGESGRESLALRTAGAANQPLIHSMAVLPFQPLSAVECDPLLGLRVADALIVRLSSLGKFIVRPTSAVRRYADAEQDPVAAGNELNVDAVLGGSLQQSGGTVRVAAQLLDARDGFPLWGARFDARFTDVFAVEDALSIQLAGALASQWIGEAQSIDARLEAC
jgi:DNA-binding winged helix-turn-helix (wHTH) protein